MIDSSEIYRVVLDSLPTYPNRRRCFRAVPGVWDVAFLWNQTVRPWRQWHSGSETTIDTVSNWISANLLSLNQSKTEFLLIGLPKQLAKVSDPNLLMHSNVTITHSDSARNLGVIFDSSLNMSDHLSSISKSCFLYDSWHSSNQKHYRLNYC